ncbi:hypothetical protein ALQ47_01950 [Pseudomonas cichorii]|nr:hypothetical protein ALQ47_01950 [Pseudomonas cichorii]
MVVDHSCSTALTFAMRAPADFSQTSRVLDEVAGIRLLSQMLLKRPVFFIVQMVFLNIGVSMKIMQSLVCVIGVA